MFQIGSNFFFVSRISAVLALKFEIVSNQKKNRYNLSAVDWGMKCSLVFCNPAGFMHFESELCLNNQALMSRKPWNEYSIFVVVLGIHTLLKSMYWLPLKGSVKNVFSLTAFFLIFFLHKQQLNWFDAKRLCHLNGFRLATIFSHAEEKFLIKCLEHNSNYNP